jgi:ABC-type branched-subunit amino acid transport system substrate-binding protein
MASLRAQSFLVLVLAGLLTTLSPGVVLGAPGVTANTIVLGESAAFSGPAAKLGEAMREGATAYFNEVNRQGGVYGRQIQLVSLDDGYEPDRAVANTKTLIDDKKGFALFGYVGTPTSYAVKPLVDAARIPFFAPFTGAQGLRTPVDRYIFNIRAGYFDETESLVDWLAYKHQTRIAVFYQNDAYGQAGLAGVTRAMDKRHLKIAASGTVERNTVDVGNAVKTIGKAHPDAVILISAYKSCAAFIKQLYATNPDTTFMNVSFVGSEALASELGDGGNGVIISQVVPYYHDLAYGITTEFKQALAREYPKSTASFNNLEGYIAAKAFVEGLQRAGQDLTREKFIAALESFRNVDFGGFPLSYSPTDHSGSRLVVLTMITGETGAFLPFWRADHAASWDRTASQ